MPRQRFSGLSLLWNSLGKHRGWREQWRRAEPQAEYDAVIVGGGGHGLGTAYYLAAEHGLTRIAVVEKGWIGGGNTGRNTTIIRSNYLFDESARLYDHSVKMWEHLSQVLNYNVMFSPRGVMMLAHTVHDVQVAQRHIHANRCNGVDNEWLTPEEAKAYCPPLNIDPGLRYPVLGAALQRRGGTARHDAVAWGYARAADALGVDIIENCEVTGIRRDAGGAVEALETSRGVIRTRKVGVVAAGNTGYGNQASAFNGARQAGLALSINDPGNADGAITVGSTHRTMPHTYGVSYFSSKGPTGDGRLKPDLVAPGEKVLSCAAGTMAENIANKLPNDTVPNYVEDSGTSMAAPHVSGAAAAFLSIKNEFIGKPEVIKQILLSTATDLGRERQFQGAGLLDLMRAIQSL